MLLKLKTGILWTQNKGSGNTSDKLFTSNQSPLPPSLITVLLRHSKLIQLLLLGLNYWSLQMSELLHLKSLIKFMRWFLRRVSAAELVLLCAICCCSVVRSFVCCWYCWVGLMHSSNPTSFQVVFTTVHLFGPQWNIFHWLHWSFFMQLKVSTNLFKYLNIYLMVWPQFIFSLAQNPFL